jgi:hypothetical protein
MMSFLKQVISVVTMRLNALVNYGVLKANSLLTTLAYGRWKSREIASRTDKLINHEPVAVQGFR